MQVGDALAHLAQGAHDLRAQEPRGQQRHERERRERRERGPDHRAPGGVADRLVGDRHDDGPTGAALRPELEAVGAHSLARRRRHAGGARQAHPGAARAGDRAHLALAGRAAPAPVDRGVDEPGDRGRLRVQGVVGRGARAQRRRRTGACADGGARQGEREPEPKGEWPACGPPDRGHLEYPIG
jgi:hypothetical protein